MSDIPKNSDPQQIEAARFRSGVSESLLQKIGGNVNYLLSAVLPVGSVIYSMLTEPQFQGETSTGWVLANGQSCSGSDYELLTGYSTVPDARGVVPRGKNNGRSTATGNSAGDLALGTYEADRMKYHTHGQIGSTLQAGGGPIVHDDGSEYALFAGNTTIGGDDPDETAVRAITFNCFFRIN